MYGLGGERLLREWEVAWLPGYENSKPVRVGNAAHEQLQLDVYGEVMDALHQARLGGHPRERRRLGASRRRSLDAPREDLAAARSGHLGSARHAAALHAFEGHGVGRVRPRHQERRAVQPRRPARPLARAARRDPRGSLRDAPSTRRSTRSCSRTARASLDASLLLIPLVGFLPADDPRVARHRRGVEKHLLVDGFVLRYDSDAHRRRPAARRRRVPRLQLLARRQLRAARPARRRAARCSSACSRCATTSACSPRSTIPRLERQVGNFPQAFSHIALLSTAFNLGHAEHQHAPAPGRAAAEPRDPPHSGLTALPPDQRISATPFPGVGKRTNTSGSCPGTISRGSDARLSMRVCVRRFDAESSVCAIGTCFAKFS